MKLPVKFHRSSLLSKVLIFLVLISSTVILVSQRSEIAENQGRTQALGQQIEQLEQSNQNLQSDVDALGTDDSVRKIAREKLGLVGPGEVLFSDIGE